jgi:hypothetical protein
MEKQKSVEFLNCVNKILDLYSLNDKLKLVRHAETKPETTIFEAVSSFEEKHSEENIVHLPILKIIQHYMKEGTFIDTNSGNGELVNFLSKYFPKVEFFASDADEENIER